MILGAPFMRGFFAHGWGGAAYTYDGMGNRAAKPSKLYWRGSGTDTLAETSTTDTNDLIPNFRTRRNMIFVFRG